MKLNRLAILVIGSLPAFLSGCATVSEMEGLPGEVNKGLKQGGAAHLGAGPQHAKRVSPPKLALPPIDLKKIEGVKGVLDRRFTLVVKRVPVKSILYSLAKDAGIQLDLHPIRNSRITLMLKDVPLRVILDRISEQAGIVYSLEGGILTVQRDVPVWRTYRVDYVNINKKSEGKISLNMSVGGVTPGGQQGGSASTGENSTKVTVASEQDFWKEIETGLKSILGEQADRANLIVNKESGTVSVRAPSRLQKVVSQYIDTVLNRAKKQVLIEATVVEVELSDKFQSGIDWSALRVSNSPTGQLPTDSQIQIVSDPRLNNIAQSFNFSFGVRFLQQFGKTKVLSTPKIMAINNQTAILKVVDNQVYFTTKVNTNTNQTTSITTYQTEVHTVPVGFMMTLTPFVGDNGDITLYVRPTLSRILGYVDDPNPALRQAGAVSKVPIIQEREISSTLRLKNGQIAIIGGLMQDTDQKSRAQLPGLGDVPAAGELFAYNDKSRRKTELVIFIRPVVINKPSLKGDLSGFQSQFNAIEN